MIRDDEVQKVASLFDPEAPASEPLARLADGRYETGDYDSAEFDCAAPELAVLEY